MIHESTQFFYTIFILQIRSSTAIFMIFGRHEGLENGPWISRFWAELWKTYSSTGKRRGGHLALLVLGPFGPSDSHVLATLGPFGPSSDRALCPRALRALGPVATLRVATLPRALASALIATQSLTQTFRHPLTHSLTCYLTHSNSHSLKHSHTHSLTQSFTY